MSKFIIGGGITGLVWKYYHPEYQIISPELPGGVYAKTYMVWMHDTYETRKLMTDLGLPIKPKRSYIGYYHRGWITEATNPTLNLILIQKKMTEWDKPLDTSFVPKTRDLSLSDGSMSNYMNTLDVDLTEVVKRLSEKASIENGYVVKIDDETIVTKENFQPGTTEKVREYDHIVSTMAAPLFWKVYQPTSGETKEREFKCIPITNVVVSKKPSFFDDKFEMVYYDDTQYPSRVSHIGDKWALEFTGEMSREKFQELYPDLPILDYFIVKQGRIFENDYNVPPNGKIVFSGRFAQWKYGIVTENVISHAIEYKEKNGKEN